MRISDWSSDVCSSDLSEHFDYVARHGKLAVRSSEGEIIDDPKRLKEIAQDWTMLDEAMNEHGRDRPTSLSLVLSMPGGDRKSVAQGKGVAVRVAPGGGRIIKKTT